MCFHTKQTKTALQLENRFKAKILNPEIFKTVAAYNGFGHPKTPVIANNSPELIKHFQWGLIPFWASDDKIKAFTLNAKIETINTTKSYKNCVNQRCLVLLDGFYEWKWLDPAGKKKQKYLISLPDDGAFALGGIWSEWTDKSTGEILSTYSIVTTEANELMAEIHNNKRRMPVLLKPEEEGLWLTGKSFDDFKVRNVELKATEI